MEYRLKVLSMHEFGKRANQEDYMYPAPGTVTDDDRCFVLCDGMGGHDSGEVASQAVCNAMGAFVTTHCAANGIFTPEDLSTAVSMAYDALDARDTHALKKMGTTMTFAKFHAGGCLVAHMGDSRVYHLRPGMGILFETRDHSLVNDLIKVGELTEETAKTFGQKNVITRCMQPNTERRSRAEIREISDIRPGDYFFMCSDGVNETMESKQLETVILDSSISDEQKMQQIVSGTAESRDNHTAFLIHVLGVSGAIPVMPSRETAKPASRVSAPATSAPSPATHQPASPKKNSPLMYVLIVVLALLCGVVGFLLGGTDGKEPAKKSAVENNRRARPASSNEAVNESGESTQDAVDQDQDNELYDVSEDDAQDVGSPSNTVVVVNVTSSPETPSVAVDGNLDSDVQETTPPDKDSKNTFQSHSDNPVIDGLENVVAGRSVGSANGSAVESKIEAIKVVEETNEDIDDNTETDN